VQVNNSAVRLHHEHDPYVFVDHMTEGSMVLAEVSVNETALGAQYRIARRMLGTTVTYM
jgi:hypothetical protein